MELRLKGKVALVTASSQGLGEAIAIQLVHEGLKVMITSRNEKKLRAVQERLNASFPNSVHYCVADLTDYADIKKLVRNTIENFKKIDIVINNSGGPPAGTFEEFSDCDWTNAFQLTLLNYIRVIREVLPYMKKEGGRIITIASTSIKQPIPGLILSNTFRMGIVGLSKSLSNELAKFNILVNTIAPGRIETARVHELDRINALEKHVSVEEIIRQSRESIPLQRYGRSEEFAKVVVFLASNASSYITGTTVYVDGGKVRSV